jgi:CheY-like chemotaxis protein
MPFGRVEPAAPAGTGFQLPHDGLHILLVDDDPLAREALELTLQTLGCETAACDSGGEALAIIHDEPDLFDLMITDYLMPNMNGSRQPCAMAYSWPIVLPAAIRNWRGRRS